MSKARAIVAVDASCNTDINGWIVRHFKKASPVIMVDTLVDGVLGNLGGHLIKALVIFGHGKPGIQGVGCGRDLDADPDGVMSLRVDTVSGHLVGDGKKLRRFRGHFTHHAVVVLSGCKSGQGEQGEALLKAVSHTLGGVAVEAGTQDQYPLHPGVEGLCIRCEKGGCYPVIGRDSSSKYWDFVAHK
jgi:hypothetical protein